MILVRQHTLARPDAYIREERDDGKVTEFDGLQCVHCQRTWKYRRGSGRERGWCQLCMGVTCGAEDCMTCMHFEKRVELLEARR